VEAAHQAPDPSEGPGRPGARSLAKRVIETDIGTVACELFDADAPDGVANFVGLARGRRPWKQGTTWKTSASTTA